MLFDPCIDLFQLCSMNSNQLKVFLCNVSVEILHVSERSFVVHHQIVYMLVLSLLNLMDLYLQSQLKLGFKSLHFLLIALN